MDALTEAINRIGKLEARLNRFESQRPHWEDWTPTITQSVSVSATVQYARYVIINNTVDFAAQLLVTGTGSAGNEIVIGGFPFVPTIIAADALHPLGVATIYDSEIAIYLGILIYNTTAPTFVFRDTVTKNIMGNSPSFTLSIGDTIGFRGSFEK